MEDKFIFSDHSVLRISERTNLSLQDIYVRLTKNVAVLVKETGGEPQFRYQVLWDSKKSKPMLIILRKMEETSWEMVTVYETMSYHRRADNVMVMQRHIDQAKKQEVRYMSEGHPQGAEGLRGHVRLHVVVRFCEYGKIRVRRHKVGSMPTHEFLSTHGGSAEKLMIHLMQLGKMNHISVPADSVVEAEVITTEDNTMKILSSWP